MTFTPENTTLKSCDNENQEENLIEESSPVKEVKSYMEETYHWAYIDEKNVNFLDKEWIVWVLLFGNAGRLKQRYIDAIKPNSKVWQVAHVYGNLVKQVAEKVGKQGVFHITDVTQIQYEHMSQKLKNFSWAKTFLQDATTFESDLKYDTICSFFLLHEVPDHVKTQVVQNMLKHLSETGQLIFVDYGNPHRLQPIRYILKMVNHYLEPYAKALWQNSIASYGIDEEKYHIEKETIFGGVYQFVRVTPKQS